MNSKWRHSAILRSASLLVPAGQRKQWLKEWYSELWYVPEVEATAFCLGSLRDALWLRQNRSSLRTLDSPAACLALLAGAAALSFLFSIALLGPLRTTTVDWRLQVRDLPGACLMMLIITSVFLPINRLVIGPPAPAPSAGRLRRTLFFVAKAALMQPILVCGFFTLILTTHRAPFVFPVGNGSMWILTSRWLILDQRRRCPVCLRILASPVHFGAASNTFLDWYGSESVCAHDHGMLQVAEIPTSYSGARWLHLAGARQP